MVEALQAVTGVLAGVALRSLGVLNGAVSLPQFRLLAVLADLGPARSGRAAQALGLETSTVTRLADRLVAAGHITRGSYPGHRGVVTLALTSGGRDLVARLRQWRRGELSRILGNLPPGDRKAVTRTLRLPQHLTLWNGSTGHGAVSRREFTSHGPSQQTAATPACPQGSAG